MKTLGNKITELRKTREMTQESLAEAMNVSSQAVSKWENDLSIPDINILIDLSNYFNVSLDTLLKNEEPKVAFVPEKQRKDMNKMTLKILVDSENGDHVKINLPMALVKVAIEIGMQLPQISSNGKLQNIDLKQVFDLVEQGVIGRIMEVQSADGDNIIIEVE